MFFKRFIVLILSVIMIASCAEQPESSHLLNAENYSGVEFVAAQSGALTAPPPETAEPAAASSTPELTSQTEPATTATTVTAEAAEFPAVSSSATASAPKLAETTAATVAKTAETTGQAPVPVPDNNNEVRGIWISYIELQSAFSTGTETGFRKAFAAMMDNCASYGINTVYVHLRAFGDAYYNSSLFPWAKQITGTVGGNPAYDPLAVMLEEASKRGISFHGWLNPMRLMTDADIKKVSADLPVGEWYNGSRKGIYIVRVGDNWYLNPAYKAVRDLIADGAAEILSNYAIDGIHIDDYFYPSGVTDAFDSAAFNADSNFASLTDFRLNNCTKMVKALYDTVKSTNRNAKFGISPQGSIERCYEIYADVKLWASTSGYCDYIAPQLYYGFKNSAQPFGKCLKEWEGLVKTSGAELIVGLAIYKIGQEDTWAGTGKNEWKTDYDIIKRQIDLSRKAQSYEGYALFSYRYLFGTENTALINTQLNKAGITAN